MGEERKKSLKAYLLEKRDVCYASILDLQDQKLRFELTADDENNLLWYKAQLQVISEAIDICKERGHY